MSNAIHCASWDRFRDTNDDLDSLMVATHVPEFNLEQFRGIGLGSCGHTSLWPTLILHKIERAGDTALAGLCKSELALKQFSKSEQVTACTSEVDLYHVNYHNFTVDVETVAQVHGTPDSASPAATPTAAGKFEQTRPSQYLHCETGVNPEQPVSGLRKVLANPQAPPIVCSTFGSARTAVTDRPGHCYHRYAILYIHL